MELIVIGGSLESDSEDFSAFVVVKVFASSSMDIISGAGGEGLGCKTVGCGAFLASKIDSVMTLGLPERLICAFGMSSKTSSTS